MRIPGFNGLTAPNAENSVQWLAEQIVADERFAEATVRFWWPAIMGVEVAAPPEDERDADFDGQLLASNAQLAEVQRLAEEFRQGFHTGAPYNLKDLLVEITLTPWFRAESVADTDPTLLAALRNAGPERLLTPEELARKTEAITGYGWGRRVSRRHAQGGTESQLKTNSPFGSRHTYKLLYGGIDSDGITQRAQEITPLMAAVARTHAAEVSCPIVRREFYFLPNSERKLFRGVDKDVSPVLDYSGAFPVTSDSREEKQTVAASVSLRGGPKTVRLRFANRNAYRDQVVDRDLFLDRLTVKDDSGSVVATVELESLPSVQCGSPVSEEFRFRRTCQLDVPVTLPTAGTFRVEVRARQQAGGDEPAQLMIGEESFDITAETLEDAQTVGTALTLAAGEQLVGIRFTNGYYRAAGLFLGGLVVRDSTGEVVHRLDSLAGNCSRPRADSGDSELLYWRACSVEVALSLAADGIYRIEVDASQQNATQPVAMLEIGVDTAQGLSYAAEAAVRRKLVELHAKLLGMTVSSASPDIDTAFRLFLEVWERKRQTTGPDFRDGQMSCRVSDHLYFEGIADDTWYLDKWGDSRWNQPRVAALMRGTDFSDANHIARSWVVILAYLLGDYRYLHY